MAEESSSSQHVVGVPEGVSMEAITNQLLSGQSKYKSDDIVEYNESDHVTAESKNKLMLICTFCNCKIMRNNKGSFVKKEMSLPVMSEKYRIGDKPTVEELSDHWLVEDMFDFENVGFTKDVESLKYLICADCERGPIGWHVLTETDKFYVSCKRVKYGQS